MRGGVREVSGQGRREKRSREGCGGKWVWREDGRNSLRSRRKRKREGRKEEGEVRKVEARQGAKGTVWGKAAGPDDMPAEELRGSGGRRTRCPTSGTDVQAGRYAVRQAQRAKADEPHGEDVGKRKARLGGKGRGANNSTVSWLERESSADGVFAVRAWKEKYGEGEKEPHGAIAVRQGREGGIRVRREEVGRSVSDGSGLTRAPGRARGCLQTMLRFVERGGRR